MSEGSASRSGPGGQAGMRGYLVQTLIALLDGLKDGNSFVSVTIEPDHRLEKVDILWEYRQNRRVVQVKSSTNQFTQANVRCWAQELKAKNPGADWELCLVGLFPPALAKQSQLDAVRLVKLNNDLPSFREQTAHRLEGFLRAQNLPCGTGTHREMLADALTARLATFSTSGKAFSRDDLTGLLRDWIAENPQTPKEPPQISPTRLRHGARDLVGRERELARLDAAWRDPRTHIVTIVAWGGVGKTALVVEWMARMARDGWPGVERVFDWSFYSQGTSNTTAASADQFVARALEFFGDAETAHSAASPWDKGERLARLMAEHKTLLVLDGIEPLQYPPGPLGGRLKDPALEALLKGLALHCVGLCLVTTRERLTDLAPFQGTTAPEWLLEHLDEEAGAQLLFRAGVQKKDKAEIGPDNPELREAVREVRGHALTLQLLGRYLAKAHRGDIRKRSLVAFEKADAKIHGGHAFRMMATYEKWLAKGGEEGQRQLAVLHLLGLFDRPADADCMDALRRAPAIKGLTEPLTGLNGDDWNTTLANLQECSLIGVHDDASHGDARPSLDAHPLVREYFDGRLRETRPKAWQEAHRRLYVHLTENTKPHRPETLTSLQPLYQAIAHGCRAGKYQDAYEKVYIDRILRDRHFHSTYTLGAFNQELSALSSFHDQHLENALRVLSQPSAARVMRQTGYCLRPLGRMADSLRWIQCSLAIHEQRHDWREAAIDAGLMSTICGSLGRLQDAVTHAGRALHFARKLDDLVSIIDASALYGHHLWQVGESSAARKAFHACRKRSILIDSPTCDRHSRYIAVLVLFRLADATDDDGQLADIRSDAEALRRRMAASDHKYGLAVANLTAALCLLKTSRTSSTTHARARRSLDRAVNLFYRAGRIDVLPLALSLRSELHRRLGNLSEAWPDIDQAAAVAERYGMLTRQCDCHLEYLRLKMQGRRPGHVSSPPAPASANLSIREHYEKVASLAAETGYRRRDSDLAELRTLVGAPRAVTPETNSP